jgi:hypothetical protein
VKPDDPFPIDDAVKDIKTRKPRKRRGFIYPAGAVEAVMLLSYTARVDFKRLTEAVE